MTLNNKLQSIILKLLANRGDSIDYQLSRGHERLVQKIYSQFPSDESPKQEEIFSAIWSLITQGLAYIDYSNEYSNLWRLALTKAGNAAAQDEATNPDNSGEFIERLSLDVPDASQTALQYAHESVISYNSRCYLASAVMLGVASEAAFLDMARSFGQWLPEPQNNKFLEILENPRTNYIIKFIEFRKRIEPLKTKIPEDLSDGMSLTLDSVLDLLRIYRNEAGHPTGKQVTRDDAFINLQIFARYLRKIYKLKRFFDSGEETAPVTNP